MSNTSKITLYIVSVFIAVLPIIAGLLWEHTYSFLDL